MVSYRYRWLSPCNIDLTKMLGTEQNSEIDKFDVIILVHSFRFWFGMAEMFERDRFGQC